MDSVKQHASVIGDHDLTPFANFINVGSYLVLPVLNALIPVIEIPSLMDGVKIETATFAAKDNYMYLTFSPIYVGEFAEIWNQKFKDEVFGARFKQVEVSE